MLSGDHVFISAVKENLIFDAIVDLIVDAVSFLWHNNLFSFAFLYVLRVVIL